MKTSRDKFNRLVDELINCEDDCGIFYKSDQTSDLYHKERSTIDDLLIRSLNVLINTLTGLRTKDWKNYPYTEDALYTAALVHAASEKLKEAVIKSMPEFTFEDWVFSEERNIEPLVLAYKKHQAREDQKPIPVEDEIFWCVEKLVSDFDIILDDIRLSGQIQKRHLVGLLVNMVDVENELFGVWKFFVWLEKYELKQIKKRAKQMELKKSSGKTEEHTQHGMGLKDYGMRCATIKNPDGGTIFITTSTDEGEDCE